MAPASAISSMSAIWPIHISVRCTGCSVHGTRLHRAIQCRKRLYGVRQLLTETARIASLPCRILWGPTGLATRPDWSATSKSRTASSAGFQSVTATSRSTIRCVGGRKRRVERADTSTRGKQGRASEPHSLRTADLRDKATYRGHRHLPQRGRHRSPRRRHPARTERRAVQRAL